MFEPLYVLSLATGQMNNGALPHKELPPKLNTQHPISGDMQVRQEFICSQAKQVQSFPPDTNFRPQCKGIIEVFHTQWAKEIIIERRVSCGGIQKNIQ